MLLLIDVGNTNICIAKYFNNKLDTKLLRIKTLIDRSSDEYFILLKEMIDLKSVNDVIISSVVPDITYVLIDVFKTHLNIDAIVLEPKVKTGIGLKAINPKEVGADLICAAAAVKDKEALIIDLGTATKYIYVKNKTLMGVVISPGVLISIKALVNETSLLPNVEIKVPNKVLGNNTISCMQSGVTYGVASQVDGMIERIKKEIGNDNLYIIATGGLAKTIIPLCNYEIEIDELLTIKGLLEIYWRNI